MDPCRVPKLYRRGRRLFDRIFANGISTPIFKENPQLKTASLYRAATVAVFAAAAFVLITVAQTPQSSMPAPPLPPQAAGVRPYHKFPAPTNLQVLPKNLTGEQVHKIMVGWSHALGTHCKTCHAPNPKEATAGHHEHLDFALDTKPEKNTARLMFKMVQDINGNYLSKIKTSGVPVSCGTCHRGHLHPPIFRPSPEHHEGGPAAAAPAAAQQGL